MTNKEKKERDWEEEKKQVVEAYKQLIIESRRIRQIYDGFRYYSSLISGCPLKELLEEWTPEDCEKYVDWVLRCYAVAPRTMTKYLANGMAHTDV